MRRRSKPVHAIRIVGMDAGRLRDRARNLFSAIGLTAALAVLGACASTTTLTPEGQAAIKQGNTAVVLIRVAGRLDNQPFAPFASAMQEANVSLGLGTFETGGEPEDLTPLNFLAEESRSLGWTYLLLRPGTYYLSVYPPRSQINPGSYKSMVDNAPRWRIDVPDDVKLIYAGTLNLTGKTVTMALGLKWWSSAATTLSIEDNLEAAGKLLSTTFPGWGEMQVMPMLRQSGPVILHAPFPVSDKQGSQGRVLLLAARGKTCRRGSLKSRAGTHCTRVAPVHDAMNRVVSGKVSGTACPGIPSHDR